MKKYKKINSFFNIINDVLAILVPSILINFAPAKATTLYCGNLFPLAQAYMKRLSLAELKEQSAQSVTSNLEAIKGGLVSDCHSASPGMDLAVKQNAQNNGLVYLIATIGDFLYNLW